VRVDEAGELPHFRATILDRGSLNIQDTSSRITAEVIELTNGETVFYFDKFE